MSSSGWHRGQTSFRRSVSEKSLGDGRPQYSQTRSGGSKWYSLSCTTHLSLWRLKGNKQLACLPPPLRSRGLISLEVYAFKAGVDLVELHGKHLAVERALQTLRRDSDQSSRCVEQVVGMLEQI